MARRKPRPKPRPEPRRQLPALPPAPPPLAPTGFMAPSQVLAARELFWHNVIREILTSLSMLCAMRPETQDGDENAAEAKADAAARGESGYDPALFDGRLAVMTKAGERVAIADVYPLFACGISNPQERGMSMALECTVFQIRTPDGHVYTLPLHEMRAFHALTPELMRRLERIAARKRASRGEPDETQQPFGFAAFTSLIQGPPPPPGPAPPHPTE